MNAEQLQLFNGCRVEVRVNGQPALGVLFCQEEAVSVLALCYVAGKRRCPLIRRDLSVADMETLNPSGHKMLSSRIELEGLPDR
jgi:hypothetical protein